MNGEPTGEQELNFDCDELMMFIGFFNKIRIAKPFQTVGALSGEDGLNPTWRSHYPLVEEFPEISLTFPKTHIIL